MSAWLMWTLVGLGLGAIAVRRPLTAAWLVTAQTLLLGAAAVAIAPGEGGVVALAAGLLAAKGVAVSTVTVVVARRTREARLHDEGPGSLARLVGSAALVAAVVALVPPFGLESRVAEDAATAMVATALALVLVRRATIFAVLAFLVAENGIAVAAMSSHGALPLVVELGMAFDLVLLITVAAAFQRRILDAFGTTDSTALRAMRD
jgi:hydrogenase-4 component E